MSVQDTLSFSLCMIVRDDEVENSGKKAAEERKMQLFSSCRHDLRLPDCSQTPEVLLLPSSPYSHILGWCWDVRCPGPSRSLAPLSADCLRPEENRTDPRASHTTL